MAGARLIGMNRTLHNKALPNKAIQNGAIQLQASPRRMLAGFSGPVLLGLGSGMSIQAGFGSFGFSVLLDGLQLTSGLPLWSSQIAFTLARPC